MAEPLKNIFSRPFLESVAAEVAAVFEDFNAPGFLATVFDKNWANLELKQRIRHISHSFRATLPSDYRAALAVLVRTTEDRYLARHGEKLTFEYTFLPDFVEAFGADDPDASLPALEILTKWSSAEFAIRPFLMRWPERTFAQMLAWSKHPSAMVRRLSSEGFRPRLPWGMGVPVLKRDPSPILPVLENLKNDPAETVRRSVANNLNDISKDHPELALDLAKKWLGNSPETDWVVRHACRGLLKKGNAEALAHFGFEQAAAGGIEVRGFQCDPTVAVGGILAFRLHLYNIGVDAVKTRLEYGIDYLTGTGKVSRKVFKIKEFSLAPGLSEGIERRQRFQDFTTRKHFPGAHRLRILVNGREVAATNFEVKRA